MTAQRRKPTPARSTGYSLEQVVKVTGVSRALLVAYCESGVLPLSPEELAEREFGDELIQTIRRVEFLRQHHGINLTGIRIIGELTREVERLREELRFRMGL
jgi:DNA-binding transcriptional MerR regulator